MPLRTPAWLCKTALAAAGLALGLCVGVLSAAEQRKPFGIVNAALLEAEDGFARADNVYLPGEVVYLAFNIQGHAVDRSSRVKLTWRIDGVDFKGIPFVEPEQGKIETELAPQDEKWLPKVRFSPAIPPFADSGRYKFAIKVRDELAKVETSTEVPFEVRGRNVESSPTLVIRNFQFARQEDGDPLPAPVYRRGDTLWASFDITGYKIGEKNLVQVEYRLAVLNEEGKKIFEQPDAAQEKGTSFYPRRYVHAVFNLALEPTIPLGEYTILLTVRDLIGNQSYESRHSFKVE